jgi:hypothetical protein
VRLTRLTNSTAATSSTTRPKVRSWWREIAGTLAHPGAAKTSGG